METNGFSGCERCCSAHGLRTPQESLFPTSGITPQLSPSEEGHGKSTPDGCTRLQGRRNLVHIIIWHMWNRTFGRAPYSKTKCLTANTGETSHTTNNPTKQTTERQSCLTHSKCKRRNPTCVQQIWTTLLLPIVLLSLWERLRRPNLTYQPHNHPRL